MKTQPTFSELLQAYFTERLMQQRAASPCTIANYRDTFCLLIAFAQRCLKKPPTQLAIQDLDAPFMLRFLDYLERERGNLPRQPERPSGGDPLLLPLCRPPGTRPRRGGAARAGHPEQTLRQEAGGLPEPSRDRGVVAAPDQNTWSGRRDHALLLVAVQTGLRVSELVGLRCQDVALGTGAHVRCTGKGRKTRCVPLRKDTVKVLRAWLRERGGQPGRSALPQRPWRRADS